MRLHGQIFLHFAVGGFRVPDGPCMVVLGVMQVPDLSTGVELLEN